VGVEAPPGASSGTLPSSTSSPYPNSAATTINSAILTLQYQRIDGKPEA
jgi:hypothetical protein